MGKFKHGFTGTRLYHIWKHMRQRCHNSKDARYGDYGGKGITIFKEWDDFKKFYNWAINARYNDDLTLDRINVNGNYEPDNCRWADYKTQENNRTNNIFIEINGEIHTMAEWEEISGIKQATIRKRLILGWENDEVLNPLNARRNKKYVKQFEYLSKVSRG